MERRFLDFAKGRSGWVLGDSTGDVAVHGDTLKEGVFEKAGSDLLEANMGISWGGKYRENGFANTELEKMRHKWNWRKNMGGLSVFF